MRAPDRHQKESSVKGFVSSGWLNQATGWTLLLVNFACSLGWMPHFPDSSGDPGRIISSRQCCIMMAGMAFLQLAAAQALKSYSMPSPARTASPWLTATGGMVYALGSAFVLQWEPGYWLVISGALMTGAGLIILFQRESGGLAQKDIRIGLSIFCFGLALEIVNALLELEPGFIVSDLGPQDGLAPRMLRLARISSFALPALACLFQQLGLTAPPRSPAKSRGRLGILFGALGIPLVLAAASFVSLKLRIFVAIPANAMFAGALAGVWLAREQGRRLESLGWLLVALSMAAGLLMGLYAFDLLLQPPQWIGGYNGSARSLIRLTHVYSIVCGLTILFISRQLSVGNSGDLERR
jgi:hypothetical protein